MRLADSFVDNIFEHQGETVTIYTTSGGASGSGFTGVLIRMNDCFIRLITRIGPAPSCALGSSCNCHRRQYNRSRYNNYNGRNIGSVVDIPIDRIVAIAYNAV